MENEKLILEEIRMFREYNKRKMRQIQGSLDLLLQFSRDDLVRLDKLEESIKQKATPKGK